jgi:hypothetical protein
VISYGLTLGGYRIYIQYSIVQLWTPGSIVSSVNIYKSIKLKILSIIYSGSYFWGRQIWAVVSNKRGWALWVLLRVGLVFLRTPVLSWKVGEGSAGGQSPTVWFYCGWHYLYVGIVPAASDSLEVWDGEEPWRHDSALNHHGSPPSHTSRESLAAGTIPTYK